MAVNAGTRRWGVRTGLAVASAIAALMVWTSGARAQVPVQPVPANCTGGAVGVANAGNFGGSSGAISSSIAGIVGSVNTAFLTQQGSAFVSAPSNPAPGQPGGGVWARGLGGEVTTKSVTTNNGAGSGGAAGTVVNDRCNNSLNQLFAGIQVGTDVAKLNLNGWNVHLGTTAGFLGSAAHDDLNGISKVGIEVPFFGAYVVATYGRFFADLMVRKEFYNITMDSPGLNLNSQTIGAHGLSVSTSAGYNFALANNWFIEPSAGFVWSSTKVDSFNSAVPDTFGGTLGGTTTTNDVTSEIGRLSVRVGTTIATPNVIYQPFATASVFHEFAGDVVSNYAFCPTCAGVGGVPAGYSQTSTTTRIGTYGQYSAGLAAQFVNTGWLGFVRADYRHGDNIDGYTGNVGLRYQFSPDAKVIPVRFAKAPAIAMPVIGATNWNGFYAGVFAGAAAGRTNVAFANDPAGANTSPHVFGPLGGFQLGYNYQVNSWVFGAEGEFGLARIFGARMCGTDDGSGNVNGFNPFYQNCSDRMNWMATAAARVGYAMGRTLFYVKGGGAWTEGQTKVDCIDSISVPCVNPFGNQYPTFNANFTETTQAKYNRVGWLVGYGTEFDLGRNWSAKAEYDYIQFGKQTQVATDGQTLLYSQASISQVKVGLNYRFNGDGAVVDAEPARMYTKAAVKAPAAVPLYDWTGFYVGGNAGGAISSKDWAFYDAFGNFTLDGNPGFAGEGSHPASGPILGGQAGYRWQTGKVVFGAEAQGNWADLNGKNQSFFTFAGLAGDLNQTHVNGLGLFTGQVGYTAFNTLLYVKGGAVVVNERYQVRDTVTNALKAQASDTRWGAAVGAGVEYAFSQNWTAGIDYVHGFMGTKTLDIADVVFGGVYETERIRQSLDLVTLRLNYKFAPSMVVAKY